MRLPVVIYADFETLHKKVDETHGKTKLESKHIPCAYSIVVVSDLPEFQIRPISYVGKNGEIVEKRFVKDLEDIRDKFHNKFAHSKKMIFGTEERAKYDSEKKCFACGEEFTFGHEKGHKVRDHCHFTGKFRGVLHNACNLRAKRVWRIPIFLHNLSSFDSHLFVKELSDNGDTNVNAIPENEQRYISFQKDRYFKVAKMGGDEFTRAVSLVFVDSVRHLQSSLDRLVSYLPKSEFNNMSKCFNEEQLTLLTRKGIFPYEYLDGFERFAESKLPSIEKFNSHLGCGEAYEGEEGDVKEIRGNCISKEDYDYACQVFEKMNCKNLGDYTKLYYLTDSLLLS